MSVNKLLSRIVKPDHDGKVFSDPLQQAQFDHTMSLGISSDPLTVFACVFAALCHDIGHRGISNAALAKEAPELRERFSGKSIAEQNSFDLAWSTLLLPSYDKLRETIFGTEEELERFRSLTANALIATGTSRSMALRRIHVSITSHSMTDIFDTNLARGRRQRWEMAFSDSVGVTETEALQKDRRATVRWMNLLSLIHPPTIL